MKRFLSVILVLALVFSLGLLGCKPAEKAEEKVEKKAVEKTPYKIGTVLSLTGPSASLGGPEKEALEMEVDKINKAGGVDGHPIELIIEDDQSQDTVANTAATKLIEQDQVLALIGSSGTPATMVVKDLASKAGVPLLALAAGSVVTAENYQWVFRTPQSSVLAVEKVLDYLTNKLKVTKIALLADAKGFGTDGKALLEKKAPEKGITIVGIESYDPDATDVIAQLTKLKGTDAQALVVWGTSQGCAVAAKNKKQLAWDVPYVGSHGIANKEFITGSEGAAEGVVFTAGKVLVPASLSKDAPQRKEIDTFTKEFKAKYDKEPNTFAGHARDALFILINALEKAGDNREELRDQIEKTSKFAGIGGVFTYSPTDHDGLKLDDLIMIEIKNGEWTELKY